MNLEDVIMRIESSGDKRALRFEENFYFKLSKEDKAVKKIKKLHKCSNNTAKMIAATSWGLFQLMGYNLYFFDLYQGNIFDYVNDEVLQIETFNLFLDKKGIDFSIEELEKSETKRRIFARYYNGDEEGYAKKIKKTIEELKDGTSN